MNAAERKRLDLEGKERGKTGKGKGEEEKGRTPNVWSALTLMRETKKKDE